MSAVRRSPRPAAGEAWYQPYVRYLKAEKCLGDELDGHYPKAATRAQMAGVLAPALSAECYDERNAEAVTVGYASHRRITDVDDYTALSERYSPALQMGHRGRRGRGRLLPSE